MTFKSRIWLLPIATAVIVSIGIAINFRVSAITSSDLRSVQDVQYPTVETVRSMRLEFTQIQEMLQQAVAEGDESALEATRQRATQYRAAVRNLKQIDSANPERVRALETRFEDYYRTAIAAARVLLGKDSGDSSKVVRELQEKTQALEQSLAEIQEAALQEFRTLLTASANNV